MTSYAAPATSTTTGYYNRPATTTTSSSTPNYQFSSVGGQLVNQNLGGLVDWMNRYGAQNPSVAALGHGTLADMYRTGINTGMAIQYNDAFLGSLANYQQGLESLRAANAQQLMAQEGAIASNLVNLQGSNQRAGYRVLGDEERKTLVTGTDQEIRKRWDARQAIRSTGSRFYG